MVPCACAKTEQAKQIATSLSRYSRHNDQLNIPAFTTVRDQLAPRDVDETRKLANVRIHVERVIGRIRNFESVNTVLPISIAISSHKPSHKSSHKRYNNFAVHV